MLPTKVRIHYNTHKKNYTVSEYVKGKGWRKAIETNQALLHNAKFHVSESGREKARREGRKNVHAFVYGELITASIYIMASYAREIIRASIIYGPIPNIRYNYKLYDSFVCGDEARPVHETRYAMMTIEEGYPKVNGIKHENRL